VPGESGKIRIGIAGTQTATFIAGISGVAVTGSQVVVNANGKLGVTASSARFKDEIKPMDKASEAIHALKPVTFRYKPELDPEGIPQFGLVAEEVEKVNADLVARDDQGKVYTVRYEAVNAMLLNEFLKEHQKVQQLEATVAQQQRGMEVLTAQLKEQASQIQKVSAQLELSKSAPQMVGNNP
jgi:trimeric autotransporter adhesin